MHPEPVTDTEVDAYLDGELDLSQVLAVEEYLARRPEAAARFMAERRERTSLRLLSQATGPASPELTRMAERLSHRLGARRAMPLRRLAVAGLAALAIVAANVLVDPDAVAAPPDYVGDAVMAYETGLLRAAMPSQIESPRFDRSDIQRSTLIRVPRLPAGWKITDAQIFPSDDGPALQLMIRTASEQEISLFAVRTPSEAPLTPRAVRHGKASVAYWRVGEMSYALAGMEAPAILDLAARDLARGQGG